MQSRHSGNEQAQVKLRQAVIYVTNTIGAREKKIG